MTTLTAPLFVRSILGLLAAALRLLCLGYASRDSAATSSFLSWGSIALEVKNIMPTIIEPKTDKEPKPQLVPPPSNEPELFAAEIAMEKKSLNIFPIFLILALVVVLGGFIFYFVKSASAVLTVPVATTALSDILKAQGPTTVHFTTGTLEPSYGGPEANYKLLEKAGVIATTAPKAKGPTSLTVNLTGPGETLLNSIDGVTKAKHADGSTTYTVPLALRQMVSVDKVTMVKPHLAQVAYTWKWVPNRLGQDFDASGSLVRSFSSYDRTTLIKSYGVDFYMAEPTKATIVLMEGDSGVWKPYTE